MYPVLVGVAVSLVGGAAACYFYLRARADRAERDSALGRAAAATDLASRLDASLKALAAQESRASEQDRTDAAASTTAPKAADFLRGSVVDALHRVLPADPPGTAKGGVSGAGGVSGGS